MRNPRLLGRILRLTGLALLLLGQACCRPPDPDPQTGVLEAGRQAFLAGNYRRAEDIYQYYLQAFPHGAFRLEAWQRLADIGQDVLESPHKAVGLLEAALLEYGRDPEAAPDFLARAGQLRQRLRDYDKAAAHFAALAELPGLAPDALARACRQLAQARLSARDPAGALEACRTCRSRLPRGDVRVGLDLWQADLLQRLDQPAAARALLQEAYDDPSASPTGRAQAGFLLGQALEAEGDKDGARRIYENIRQAFPNPLVVDQRLGYLRP